MNTINISKDFSDIPGGRHIKQGPFSGEAFRTELLKKAYLEAVNNGDSLIINFDGCYGFPPSFLDESFGGLARELKDKNILKNIQIICFDNPYLENDLRKIVNEAFKKTSK